MIKPFDQNPADGQLLGCYITPSGVAHRGPISSLCNWGGRLWSAGGTGRRAALREWSKPGRLRFNSLLQKVAGAGKQRWECGRNMAPPAHFCDCRAVVPPPLPLPPFPSARPRPCNDLRAHANARTNVQKVVPKPIAKIATQAVRRQWSSSPLAAPLHPCRPAARPRQPPAPAKASPPPAACQT